VTASAELTSGSPNEGQDLQTLIFGSCSDSAMTCKTMVSAFVREILHRTNVPSGTFSPVAALFESSDICMTFWQLFEGVQTVSSLSLSRESLKKVSFRRSNDPSIGTQQSVFSENRIVAILDCDLRMALDEKRQHFFSPLKY
jgi:hypothetical protein